MKKAFTMLELVFVIVILGILAFVFANGWERNTLREAADQIVSHIRYTQHLAMHDDKFDPRDATWYRERWQIRFRNLLGEIGYVIFSDRDQDANTNTNEIAVNPLNGGRLNGFLDEFKKGNLTASYGINNVLTSCLTNDGSLVTANLGSISFDALGRPYRGVSNATQPFQYLLAEDCNITLSNNRAQSVVITVRRETGYTSITSQNY